MATVDHKKRLNEKYPKEWLTDPNTDIMEFHTLEEFKRYVKNTTQIDKRICGIHYDDAVKMLLKEVNNTPMPTLATIRAEVYERLQKKGLLKDKSYESYQYDCEGEVLDVAKVLEGDPKCYLKSNEKYISYFYELFIDMTYSHKMKDAFIARQLAKIINTVLLLEKEKIFIKITAVVHTNNTSYEKNKTLITIPIFNYDDLKTPERLASILSPYFLRKFIFALFETEYGGTLNSDYGKASHLLHTIALDKELDPVRLVQDVYKKVMIGV